MRAWVPHSAHCAKLTYIMHSHATSLAGSDSMAVQGENGGSRCETNGSCHILMESAFHTRQITREIYDIYIFNLTPTGEKLVEQTDGKGDQSNPRCACVPRV